MTEDEDELWLPRRVTWEEAVRRASFPVLRPAGLNDDWQLELFFSATPHGGLLTVRATRGEERLSLDEGRRSFVTALLDEYLDAELDEELFGRTGTVRQLVEAADAARTDEWDGLTVRVEERDGRSGGIIDAGETELLVTSNLPLADLRKTLMPLQPALSNIDK